MRVMVYPADRFGCGYHRLIWVSEILQKQGYDVQIALPGGPQMRLIVSNGVPVRVITDDCDVAVFQRVTHSDLAAAIPLLRQQGIATVVDVDDDLGAIHPSNPAFQKLHPKGAGRVVAGKPYMHSWHNLLEACRESTLVTVTTPPLLKKYGGHGRGKILPNYLSPIHYGVPHEDSDVIGWPAALPTHPNDPAAVGNAISRLVREGARFQLVNDSTGVGKAFGLPEDPPGVAENTAIEDYPALVATLGIGIAPLADTAFNAAKSWLKPLEFCAVGVPFVASPRAEYVRLHNLGAGWLADKPNDWYKKLRLLWKNKNAREDLAGRGREVADTLRLEDHAWLWWEAWSQAHEIQKAAK